MVPCFIQSKRGDTFALSFQFFFDDLFLQIEHEYINERHNEQ